MSEPRNIVITPALPYANGSIHLGHMLEHVMADIMARFYRLRGDNCLLICADDTHGTPIMLGAKARGITPEQLIEQSKNEHLRDFEGFEVAFDNYSMTHADSTREIADKIFKKLEASGYLKKQSIEQAYCEHDKMFLPDRFIKGNCPSCGAEDQYGDSCEACGAVYSPVELKNSACALCGNPPVSRSSEHLFLDLESLKEFLGSWITEHTPKEVQNKLFEWLGSELQPWCISRDAPYFGFEIPGHPNKYYYVWFDAPIGYIGSLKEWCERNSKDVLEFWNDPKTEVFHIIGKDIVYHHALFWPAMLKANAMKTPTKILPHGMLMVNGKKMSKSRGTFILASKYLEYLEPSYFRYYLACKLNGSIEDQDFSFDDFVARVNSDLVGKITNVASRGAQMLAKLGGGLTSIDPNALHLIEKAQALSEKISENFEKTDFSKVTLLVRSIADDANKYFDEHEPWKSIKQDPEKTRAILSTVLNLFRIMSIYLKPILPSYAKNVETLFREEPFTWSSLFELREAGELNPYTHLMKRIDRKQLDALQTASVEKLDDKKPDKKSKKVEKRPEISIDDFLKIELRVAKIVCAEEVEGADKLLRLELDLGDSKKQVFAGIKSAYQATELVGRLTVVVANLAPRKMKFGISEGMVLAAGKGIHLLSPDEGAKPGDLIS